MLRGYRIAIIAAFGWLIVAANESGVAPSGVSDNQATSERATSLKTPQPAPQAIAVPKAPEPETKDAGCSDGKDRRDSDLCAQWKAADAAFDAARAGESQINIGWIGLMLGFVTMGAAIAAALYAKDAAKHTKDSVDATQMAAGPDLVFSGAIHVMPPKSIEFPYTVNVIITVGNQGNSAAHSLSIQRCAWGFSSNEHIKGAAPIEQLSNTETIQIDSSAQFEFKVYISQMQFNINDISDCTVTAMFDLTYRDRLKRRYDIVGLYGNARKTPEGQYIVKLTR